MYFRGRKMKSSHKKILIAILFVALMLVMPLSNAATDGNTQQNLNLQKMAEEQEIPGQQTDGCSLAKMIDLLGDQSLQLVLLDLIDTYGLDNLESGKVVLTQTQISQVVQKVIETEELSTDVQQIDGGATGQNTIQQTDLSSGQTVNGGYTSEQLKILNNYGVNPLLGGGKGGLWKKILQYIIGGFGSIIDLIAEADNPRAGYLNGICDFYVEQNQLLDNVKESLYPNVTWTEAIEETFGWFGIDFSVHDYCLNTLPAKLTDLAQNRTWIIKGFGIRKQFYEQHILPLILAAIPTVCQKIYDKLNEKVEWGKGLLNKLRDKFGGFMGVFKEKRGKERRRGILTNFTRVIGTVIRVSIVSFAYYLYMNDTQRQEYIQGVYDSVDAYTSAWQDFINWMGNEPWLDDVTVEGNVTGLSDLSGVNISTDCSDGQWVYTDSNGSFGGLVYNPVLDQDSLPYGLHKCVTTATDEDTGASATVGTLDENGNFSAWLLNRELVGSFSGGTVNVTIDFSGNGGSNLLPQSQGYTAQQTTMTQTQKTTTLK